MVRQLIDAMLIDWFYDKLWFSNCKANFMNKRYSDFDMEQSRKSVKNTKEKLGEQITGYRP